MATTHTFGRLKIPHWIEVCPEVDDLHAAMLQCLLPDPIAKAIVQAQNHPQWDDSNDRLVETHEGGGRRALSRAEPCRRFRGWLPCGRPFGVDLRVSRTTDAYHHLLVVGFACPFEGNEPTWFAGDTLKVLALI